MVFLTACTSGCAEQMAGERAIVPVESEMNKERAHEWITMGHDGWKRCGRLLGILKSECRSMWGKRGLHIESIRGQVALSWCDENGPTRKVAVRLKDTHK